MEAGCNVCYACYPASTLLHRIEYLTVEVQHKTARVEQLEKVLVQLRELTKSWHDGGWGTPAVDCGDEILAIIGTGEDPES